jgi:ATP-binding cassette subfamily B protein
MVAKFYGKNYSLQTLRDKSYITREGVSMLGISDAAEAIGFRSMGVRITFEQLMNEAPLPCVAHWKQNHFVVVYKIKEIPPTPFKKGGVMVYVTDPARGLIKFTKEEFLSGWANTKEEGEDKGLCLLLETTPDFYQNEDEKPDKSRFKFLFTYLRPYKKIITQLILGLLLGSLLQLILTNQSLVIDSRSIEPMSLVSSLALPLHKWSQP